MDFRLAQPEALWGLIPLGLFAIYLLWKRVFRSQWFSWRRFWLSCLGFAFCVLAMARPQSGSLQGEPEMSSPTVLVAMDISNSMLAEDITPSRLGFSVLFVQRILDSLVKPRIALYPFAASGFLQMPFTTDVYAIQESLQSLEPSAISHQGTDFNESLTGLSQLLQKLEDNSLEQLEGWQAPKIILFSDGEAHSPLQDDTLKPFQQKKIPIYTVGVGTPEGASLRIESSTKQIVTKLDPAPLQAIALKTGGAYFSSNYQNIPVLLSQINQSLSFGKRSRQFKVQTELFPFCFILSLIFFFWEFCFGRWQYVIRCLAVFLVFFQSSLMLAEDNQSKAIDIYNKGLIQIEANQLEKAAELFEESALMLQKPDEKKKAFFNLGNAFLKMGDPEQALESYQKAFRISLPDQETEQSVNQRISENMALASQILEQMKQNSKPQGSDDKGEGGEQEDKDPKGPQKFQGDSLSEQQKQKLYDLITSEEKQTQRRLREQKRPAQPSEAQPW